MPWDEMGLNKFGDPLRKPNRVTFSVEVADGGFICDIHPAFAIYISNILTEEKQSADSFTNLWAVSSVGRAPDF